MQGHVFRVVPKKSGIIGLVTSITSATVHQYNISKGKPSKHTSYHL